MRNWKPIFIENSRIPKLLSYVAPIDIGAITLGFIVLSRGNYIRFRDGSLAYYNIRAEKEAFQHQETKDYLQFRPRWRWIKWK